MLSMKIDHLIAAIVKQELVGKGRSNEAMHFHLDVSLSHYIDSVSYNERRGIHLLYHLNPDYASITVFAAMTSSPFTKVSEMKPEQWQHEVTHDSCWRNINIFSQTYFGMACEINRQLKDDGHNEIAPREMEENISFGLFGPVYNWVGVKITKDPIDSHNYRRLVTLT